MAVKKKARAAPTRKVAKKKTTKRPTRARKKKAKKKAPREKRTKKADKAGQKSVEAMRELVEKYRGKRPDCPMIALKGDPVAKIPTRFAAFNAICGGGINTGSVVEVFGPEGAGKTSWTIAAAADVQRQAPKGRNYVVVINYERHSDYEWWEALGLDTTEEGPDACFVHVQPRSLEEGAGVLESFLETGTVCAAVIDSIYAARPKGSKEMFAQWRDPKKGGMAGAGGIGLQARQWGIAWTGLKDIIYEQKVICFAINQERIIIDAGGGRAPTRGKAPTTTPGGRALKYYSWVRIALTGGVLLDHDGKVRKDVDGRRVRMVFVKNKISKELPGRVGYDLIRGVGWDMTKELVDLSIQSGAIKHTGGGNYYIGKKRMHGRHKLLKLIESHDKLREALETHTRAYLDKTIEENRDEIEKVLGIEE